MQARAQSSKRIQTHALNIGYEESGQGFPVILLHGFPDDAHAWVDVAPPLVKAGYRVLAPYLRGYGPTSFRDPNAPRMAEQAAIGQDVIDFADALRLDRFALSGYDWGGRAACIAAALHPDRVRAAVLISGDLIQNTIDPAPPGSPETEKNLWVSVLLQHRAWASGPDREPPSHLQVPMAKLVTHVALHRRDVRPDSCIF